MTKRITFFFSCLLLFLLLTPSDLFSAKNGNIKGTILDVQTQSPLPYSTVILVKTSFGSSSDIEGNYTISNVPPGTYTLRVQYVGYKQEEITVEIKDGESVKQDFNLIGESIEGETVVVTAQAEGQLQAINEQLSSIPIKNVVSMSRIRELPDANAAESVSRLPGVSLIRTGGEGSKVVIRGLSPQYNRITIDGVELPANVTSSDPNDHKNELKAGDQLSVSGDRAADLSMISSNSLGGIEVIKAITPDMDATVFGGVINFSMRKATKTTLGQGEFVPSFELLSQGTYNNLKSSAQDYKFSLSSEKRFFDNGFGVFVQGSVENKNLSSQELAAEYVFEGLLLNTDKGDPEFNTMTLSDIIRDRDRYNGTMVLDYDYGSGSIGLMNFFSRSKTLSLYRNEKYNLEDNDLFNSATHSEQTLDVFSNLLNFKQDFGFFRAEGRLSHSYSYSETPNDVKFNFWQNDAGFQNKITALKYKSPKEIASFVKHNPASSAFFDISNVSSISKDRVYNAGLDFLSDFSITDNFAASIKLGGSYQHRVRSYDYNMMNGSVFYDDGSQVISAIARAYPELAANGVLFDDFIDPSYNIGTFLKGDYQMGAPFNVDLMMKIIDVANNNPGTGTGGGYKLNRVSSRKDDYSGTEDRSAGYIMGTFNIGQMFTITPGVRYQTLTTEYNALRGRSQNSIIIFTDADEKQTHGYWLPMIHFRVKPLDWLQFHIAYTNTLNYPDYNTIIPKYYIGTNWIEYNNFKLKPARSENIDAVLSIFANEVGLFTIGGFKKSIRDLIFSTRTHPQNFEAYPELNSQIDKKQSYILFTYINNPYKIDVYGIETEWQTNFWYLPDPLNGLVLNINYAHIFSEADYPKNITLSYLDSNFIQRTSYLDTTYSDRLLNQPKDIINVTLGFDYKDFSIRTSLLYQDNIFKKPDFWKQNRVHSDKYVRFDMSVKQNLPWFGLQVYMNFNNISGEDDIDINQQTGFYTSQQRYGMTTDLGLRMKL